MTNIYGLDDRYFKQKLQQIVNHLGNTTPEEMSRMLLRLAITASEKTVWQEMHVNYYEFLKGETND